MSNSGYAAGFSRAMFWLLDDSGYGAGQLGGTMENGEASGAYVADDVKSASLNYVDPTTLDIQGGDRKVATFQFGSASLGQFDLTTSLVDTSFIATFSGSSEGDGGNTSFPLVSTNPNETDLLPMGVALIQRFQPKSTGSDGSDKYHTLIIPRATCTIKMAGPSYQSESDVTISITPTMTNKFYTGQTMDGVTNHIDLGLAGYRTDHVSVITTKPFHIMSYKGLDTDTTFTTSYKPISTAVDANSVNWQTIEGVTTLLTSLTLAGVATPASITNGEMHVLSYQTAFEAVS